MASRRSRIKGIANIPQRRKYGNEIDIKLESISQINSIHDIHTGNISKSNTFEDVNNSPILTKCDEPINLFERNGNIFNNQEGLANKTEIGLLELPQVSDENVPSADVDEINSKENNIEPVRKQLIKPVISFVSKKSKKSNENIQEQLINNPASNLQNISTVLKGDFENKVPNIEFKKELFGQNENNEAEITLNEINFAAIPHADEINNQLHCSVMGPNIKPLIIRGTKNVDLEYPPPPSPSITNRVRIKAIPKLRYRKTSFSASESEDEMRKSSRIRNDSVCSSTSVNTETALDGATTQKSKEINTIIQKKCNRTEQTRKLAEARREFQRRFSSNVDRQKLTMMDLIFYNPDTNPMQKTEPKSKMECIAHDNSKSTLQVDFSTKQFISNDKSDEENDVPVPQIKIGPSGEIILDEKSLVIERKNIKKQREEIAKSEVINGDFDVGYGVYKKHKRSKFWTTDETLRFYKALNTLGTDFTLMCELFPERSRRELKMKFNKEEKINRSLIDKALMQPCGFDFYVLKEEVELEKRERAELENLKLEESKKKQEKKEKEMQRKRKKIEDVSQGPEAASAADESQNSELHLSTLGSSDSKAPEKKKTKKMKRKRLDINTVLEDTDDADESDLNSNSEDEVISTHKPTRSGRMPKVPRKFDVKDEMVVEKIVKKSKDEIEPGSIMIITENGPTGEPVYKIFMITEDNEKTSLSNSDEETKGIQLKKGITAKNILTISATHTDDEEMEDQLELPIENNVTIPADETITTLKTHHSSINTEVSPAHPENCPEQDENIRMRDKFCQASEELLKHFEYNSNMLCEDGITNTNKGISTQTTLHNKSLIENSVNRKQKTSLKTEGEIAVKSTEYVNFANTENTKTVLSV